MTSDPEPDGVSGTGEAGLRWDAEVDGATLLPILVRTPLTWRVREDGRIDLDDPRRGRPRDVNKRYLPVLEGLAAGDLMPRLRERLQAAHPDWPRQKTNYILRTFLSFLEDRGLIEVGTPPPPERLADRYDVVRLLGRGGMGVVWLARDTARPGAPEVAVKHAWNWRGSFAKRDRALRDEAEVMAAVDHPRIVRLLDTFEVDGRFHLVRDFMPGVPLSQAAREGRRDPAFRLHAARQMVEALVALRDAGYLHSDFKPGNFFVLPDGDLVLGDLGMCRRLAPGATSAVGVISTDMYAPPEVYRDRVVDERTLVFVFGRAYRQLVTGRSPRITSTLEKLVADRAGEAVLLAEGGASEAEIALVDACTRPEPDLRPRTFEELLARIPAECAHG